MDTSNFKEVFESPKVKTLTAQVAALELEVASLRSVMADVIKAHGYAGGTPIEALSTPFTPTALSAMIAKAGEVTRERCRVELKRLDYWYSADAIRAIPNVTLEELL